MLTKIRVFCVVMFVGVSPLAVSAETSEQFDCIIEPWQRVHVSFADKGLISQISVEQGDSVEEGQELALLDSRLERANVNYNDAKSKIDDEIRAMEAALALGQRNLKRLRALHKNNAVSASVLDEAETDVAVAAQKLETAKNNQRLAGLELNLAIERLNQRYLKSPLAGVVVKLHKHVGEYVEYDPVMTLEQIDTLRVLVLLPLKQFGNVRKGMKAKVIPEAPMSDNIRIAKVVVVDSGIDVASGTFGVQLEIENEKHDLPSGLKCGVRFL